MDRGASRIASSSEARVLIIGGGLAGLSTAYHLEDQPHLVLEAGSRPGGLCRSRTVDGFVFDYTGHLLHLRDPRILAWVEELLPDTQLRSRRAAIRTRGVTVPFPFQAHLHGLDPELVASCLTGFVRAMEGDVPTDPATSFLEWTHAVFGEGISDAFMIPYNRKVFRREPEHLTADWVSWAVPRPSLEQVVRGALGLNNQGMGYNSTFRYPRTGGIEALAASLARRVPHVRCEARVVQVDLDARTCTLESGEVLAFTKLVATNPLPRLLEMLRGGEHDWAGEARHLDWSVVACLNLGVARARIADGHHWIYFPDDDTPFYRVGFPSNISEGVAPAGCSSMYVEIGLKRGEPFDANVLQQRVLTALRRQEILEEGDELLVADWVRIDPGYVIFDRARQGVMKRVIPALEAHGVYATGRYGAWTYSYMERALLDGMELAPELRVSADAPAPGTEPPSGNPSPSAP